MQRETGIYCLSTQVSLPHNISHTLSEQSTLHVGGKTSHCQKYQLHELISLTPNSFYRVTKFVNVFAGFIVAPQKFVNS